MLKLSADGSRVSPVWKSRTLDSQFGGAVLLDGYLYGSGQNSRGWHCLDWRTGEVNNTSGDLGRKGAIIFADGLFYLYSERGDVGLVRPDPSKFEVISSFKVTMGTEQHWAHPVISNGRLYIRHGEALMVYDISD